MVRKRYIILINIFIGIAIILSIFLNKKIINIKQNSIYAIEQNITKCTYKKVSVNKDNEKTEYSLKFFNENGIQSIEYNNTILTCNNKKNVGIDLTVYKDKKTIVTVTTTGQKKERFPIEYVENISEITIESGYQKLTDTGIVETGEEITANILYTNTKGINYYSINNGEWIEYTGTLRNLNQNDYIRAKTVTSDGYGESDTYEITIPSSTKLPLNVYDKDDTTYVDGMARSYLIIDKSMKGKKIKIKTLELSYYYRFFNILSYDKEMKEQMLISATTYNGTIEIPEEAKMISIYSQGNCRVYTIEPYIL